MTLIVLFCFLIVNRSVCVREREIVCVREKHLLWSNLCMTLIVLFCFLIVNRLECVREREREREK